MNPLQKMRLLVARGVLNLVKNAGLQVMQINLLEGETRDDVERVQNFGHSGHPPVGATLVAVAVGGSRDHMIVVACEHPGYSPALDPGESAMYAQPGQLFKLDKNGDVTLTCKNFTVNASGNIVTVSGGSITQTASGSLGISAAGGSDVRGGFNADRITGDYIESNGKVLDSHRHTGVVRGGETSGGPV